MDDNLKNALTIILKHKEEITERIQVLNEERSKLATRRYSLREIREYALEDQARSVQSLDDATYSAKDISHCASLQGRGESEYVVVSRHFSPVIHSVKNLKTPKILEIEAEIESINSRLLENEIEMNLLRNSGI